MTEIESFLKNIYKFRNATDPVQLEAVAVLDALTLAIREQQGNEFASTSIPEPVYYFAAILTSLSERKSQEQPLNVTRNLLFILSMVILKFEIERENKKQKQETRNKTKS